MPFRVSASDSGLFFWSSILKTSTHCTIEIVSGKRTDTISSTEDVTSQQTDPNLEKKAPLAGQLDTLVVTFSTCEHRNQRTIFMTRSQYLQIPLKN